MPVVLSNLKHFLSSSDRLEEKRECISVLFLLLEQLQTNLAVHVHRHSLLACNRVRG
jgi:hypothetical protein